MKIQGVLETCLYVADLEASETFYVSLLGLEVHSRQPGRHCFLRCGAGMLLLFRADATQHEEQLPPHGCQGQGHIAFAVAREDLPAWETRLERAGVTIEHRATWSHGNRSLYFRDPTGNSLELASPGLWGLAEPASGPRDQRSARDS